MRQTVEPLCCGQERGPGREIVPECLARGLRSLFRKRGQPGDRFAIGGAVGIGSNPRCQRLFAFRTAFDEAHPARTFELAACVLLEIVEAREQRFVFHPCVRTFRGSILDGIDPFVHQLDVGRVGPAEGVLYLCKRRVTRCRPRITCSHHEIAVLKAARAHLEMMFGPIGDVVFRIIRRRAVGRDIGPVKGEIPGVARPHPVIDIAAVQADRISRGIDQPDIANFQPLDQRILRAAVKAGDEAAVTGLLFAFGGDVLAALVDGFVAFGRRHGVETIAHPRRHIGKRSGHIDTRSRRGRKFVFQRLGEEAVLEIVVLGRGIVLHRSACAVMIGHHQAELGQEAARATLQLDDSPHRITGQVSKDLRIQLQSGFAQIVGDFRQLLRSKHAFLGCKRSGGGAGHQGCDSGSVTHR